MVKFPTPPMSSQMRHCKTLETQSNLAPEATAHGSVIKLSVASSYCSCHPRAASYMQLPRRTNRPLFFIEKTVGEVPTVRQININLKD